jgi:carboxymethylenebutenolidase
VVTGSPIEVPVPGGAAEAWLSRPAGDDDRPGVLFFTDAFGVRPQIEQMADRIAGWGYVVLVPNVFHRAGSIAQLAPTVDLRTPDGREGYFRKAMPRVRALTPERARPDIEAYVDALTGLPGVAAGPIGVTGYCMGARLALQTACQRPDVVAACGCFHGGRLATEDDDSPHRGLPGARAAFVVGHADKDHSMPAADIRRLDAALDDAGVEHLTRICTGAAHGYTMADTSAYDEEAAEWHYGALAELFTRCLAGRSPDR